MTKMSRVGTELLLVPEVSRDEVDWANLAALSKIVRIEPDSGAVTIANGNASVTLFADGTIRIDGTRIINSAEENFLVLAATIDLN